MIPLGGFGGLLLGVRYRRTVWIKVISILSAVCAVAFAASIWGTYAQESKGLAAGISQLLAFAILIVLIVATAISLVISTIVAATVTVYDARRERYLEANPQSPKQGDVEAPESPPNSTVS